MATKRYSLIDLGSKIGGSLDKYRQELSQTHFGVDDAPPEQCLAIERNRSYEKTLRSLGCDVLVRDIFAMIRDNQIPRGQVWLACNVLEHFKSIEASQKVLRNMLVYSSRGVWLRLPSFEQDETGEGRLNKYDLRFNWTSWQHHPSHFCLKHVDEGLAGMKIPHKIFVKPGRLIYDSDHPNILPNLQKPNLGNYDPGEHGPITKVKFNPPIVGEWDVQVVRYG